MWADFGWWVQPNGQRRLLSWNAATKELKLWGLDRLQEDEVIAVIDSESEVRDRLEGWANYNETEEGRAWLEQQLAK